MEAPDAKNHAMHNGDGRVPRSRQGSARRAAAPRRSVSLFEQPSEPALRMLVRERVAAFAGAVGRRHLAEYGTHPQDGDRAKLLTALRGYYVSWSYCAPFRLPELDEELLKAADAAYAAARSSRKRPKAA